MFRSAAATGDLPFLEALIAAYPHVAVDYEALVSETLMCSPLADIHAKVVAWVEQRTALPWEDFLDLAISAGNPALVERALQAGAEVDEETLGGVLATRSWLPHALEIIKLLLAHGAVLPDLLTEHDGGLPLEAFKFLAEQGVFIRPGCIADAARLARVDLLKFFIDDLALEPGDPAVLFRSALSHYSGRIVRELHWILKRFPAFALDEEFCESLAGWQVLDHALAAFLRRRGARFGTSHMVQSNPPSFSTAPTVNCR